MPVIPVKRVVDNKRIIGKNGEPRRKKILFRNTKPTCT
jgi:hypothetical protein